MTKEVMKQEQDEPVAWIFEDELPKNYPYEEMFPYSKIDVVRMFPIFGPSSKKEQASSNNEVLLQYPKENVEWQKQQMEHAQQLKAEALKQEQGEPKCKTHPDAPHGFVRNASHSEDRYVCECEFWEPPEQGEPVGEVSDHDWSTGLLYRDLKPGTKLYTTPQTKKWVGLTKEDMSEFASKTPHWEELCYLVEAKLKEKTHE